MNARGRNDRSLIRIATMLAALAVLAERAGSRSLPTRWFVLSVLRWAESVACTFVAEATQTDFLYLEEQPELESHSLDAAWLAWRFRLLAAALGALMRQGCRSGSWHPGLDCTPLRYASGAVLIVCGVGARRSYDTS